MSYLPYRCAISILLLALAACSQNAGREPPSAVDVGFAQWMVLHHDQAILIAQIARTRQVPAPVAVLADSIITQQLLEIGQMQGWLQLWDQPALPTSRTMDWMRPGRGETEAVALAQYRSMCSASPGGMPGMASTDQLNEYRSLSGVALESMFLRLMIRHHKGALPMAQFAADKASNPAVQTMARRIAMEQTLEISEMAGLLASID